MPPAKSRLTVKVSKEALLKSLKEKHEKCMKDYEQALKTYELEKSLWPKKVITHLQGHIEKVKKNPDSYKPDKWGNAITIPDRPSKPVKPTGLANVIALVEMSDPEVISLNEEKYEEYMRGCRL